MRFRPADKGYSVLEQMTFIHDLQQQQLCKSKVSSELCFLILLNDFTKNHFVSNKSIKISMLLNQAILYQFYKQCDYVYVRTPLRLTLSFYTR